MIPSIHITINSHHFDHVQWFRCLVPSMFIHHRFWIQCQWSRDHYRFCDWFYAQPVGLTCGYGYWRRCGSMLEQLRWLRSIDVNSGRNYFQAASNNKDADKEDKYKDKPFVSEVVRLCSYIPCWSTFCWILMGSKHVRTPYCWYTSTNIPQCE